MSKLPSFQFYPGDWRKDPNLSRASLQAKGAMIEIMCLAFECEKRGVLKTGSQPWSIEDIARAIGGDMEINKSAIQELLDKKVLKKDRKGAIFSQRMCNDDELRKVRQEAGSKGGNPILLNQKVNHRVKQGANQNLTPSTSSSSSSSYKINSKQAFEFLRTATHPDITDQQIWTVVSEMELKYEGVEIKNLKAMCDAWAENMKPIPKITKSSYV